MSDPISELFGLVCRHCGDPRAAHERPAMDGKYGKCFISSCSCSGYELDNLKYLEEKSRDVSL
jgi:hypothetical protein